jgi:hypothetical protein
MLMSAGFAMRRDLDHLASDFGRAGRIGEGRAVPAGGGFQDWGDLDVGLKCYSGMWHPCANGTEDKTDSCFHAALDLF